MLVPKNIEPQLVMAAVLLNTGATVSRVQPLNMLLIAVADAVFQLPAVVMLEQLMNMPVKLATPVVFKAGGVIKDKQLLNMPLSTALVAKVHV